MSQKLSMAILTKKSNRFLRFYVAFIWVLIVIIIVGWFLLHKTLSTYENSLAVTYAERMVQEFRDGDLSSLTPLLNETDLDALKTHIDKSGLSFTEARELSREKGDYTFRITSQGASMIEFTLTPDADSWKMISASISDNLRKEYFYSSSLALTESLKEQIAACSYETLHPLMASTGFSEDTVKSFESFMRKNTPDQSEISFVRNDENDVQGYDIIFGKSRFGHVDMKQGSDGAWKVSAFDISSVLKDSYILHLADEKANSILSMVQNLESESLYNLCTANGYPEGHLSGFETLLSGIESIESATCSLFENSDGANRNYLISTTDKRIISFTLNRQQSGDASTWGISSFEMPVWVPFDGTITAPACFTVIVDGKALTHADEVSRALQKNIDDYLIKNFPNMVTDITYSVKSAFQPQSIVAISSDGREGELVSAVNNNYRFDLPGCDEEYEPVLHDFLKKFAETFGLFTINDAPSYNSMMEFVDRNTSAYTYIYKGDYYWTKDHYEDRTSFANFRAENFISYDDQTVACDIRYEMTVVYHRDDTVETYYPGYRVFLRINNGKWRIFSFNTLSDE